ncbi:hypothetical protein DFH09DRAFT_1308795 [Mycena vulgaris]|nr:hypothetical protein DFH09DRAFT_1308795 [Mycena vulgaris]
MPRSGWNPRTYVKNGKFSWRTSIQPRTGRNPGRRDGFHWNGDTFICPAMVDGFRRDVRDTEAADAHEEFARVEVIDARAGAEYARTPRYEVAILDIARHVKLKDEGVFLDATQPTAEDFESEWEDIDGDEFDFGSQDDDADYLFARRLQDEEDAMHAHRRRDLPLVSGTRRKAYADVLRDNPTTAEASFQGI